ncbi:MAG: endonuclease/exonuclease/phosphatase family protein [Sulfurospirillaceae bacterium]|nr:endonuclease/exonuclease/phosphatase family protein [Sulfurospirillaceae bacterium]
MSRFLLLLCVPLLLFSLDFKVASYNVENLFDLVHDGSEYEEYIPNNEHLWNAKNFEIKIANIARVIKDLDADVLALEEIENKEALKQLNNALGNKKYPYMYAPKKKKTSATDCALLSRFPIVFERSFFPNAHRRGIHEVVIKVDAEHLSLYLNHWPAQPEKIKERMHYVQGLKEMITQSKNSEFVLLGDFNSLYKENKKGWGRALNEGLGAGDIGSRYYNLWYQIPAKERYSHGSKRKKTTLDHILVPPSMSDKKGVDYVASSFGVFRPNYATKEDKTPIRWQFDGQHKGDGFSDHFPIFAIFTTKPK